MPSTHPTDWHALIAGEHAALERLYRAHAPALLRYGRRYAEAPAVEDALHELFVRLWTRHAALNPEARPRPYLLIALRNDLLRHTKRSATVQPLGDQHRGTTPSIEQHLVAREEQTARSRALRTAIDGLSPRERELVQLRFEQALDYDDIVALTGITYQSARNTLARAIGKLRQRVDLAAVLLALGTGARALTYLLASPYA